MTGNDTRNDLPDDTDTHSGSTSGQQLEVSSDEDWKSRVKAEDAALDEQFHNKEPHGEKTHPAETNSETPAAPKDQGGGPTPPPREGPAKQEPAAKRQESAPREGAAQTASPQFPEASLAGLIGLLSTQSMVALGLIPNPGTNKAERELPLARYFIDLIAVLEKKTAGNLDREEAAALDETLHTLRMAYVQRSKETA